MSGEINETTKEVCIKFMPIDEKEFIEINVDITDIFSNEELIEKINNMEVMEDKYIKIVLVRK